MMSSIARSSPFRAAAISDSSVGSRQYAPLKLQRSTRPGHRLPPGETGKAEVSISISLTFNFSLRDGENYSASSARVNCRGRCGHSPRRMRSSAARTSGSSASPEQPARRLAAAAGTAPAGAAASRSENSRALIACTPPRWATCRRTASDETTVTSRPACAAVRQPLDHRVGASRARNASPGVRPMSRSRPCPSSTTTASMPGLGHVAGDLGDEQLAGAAA